MQPFVLLTMKESDHVVLNSDHSSIYVITRESFNPLTTNDAFWHQLTLAACYQLAQSILKIGSVLAERVGQGEVGGCTPLVDSAWRLLQLALGPGQCLVGHLFAFLHKRV